MTRKLKFTITLLACLMPGILLKAAPSEKISDTRQKHTMPQTSRSASPLGAGISLIVTFGLAFGVRRLMDRRIPTDDIT
jgi:hypothetical protein